MTALLALTLGILQGLTEFLPVSSSGHLALAQKLFGLKNVDELILFDLVCHLGSLGAICTLLWRDIIAAFTTKRALLLLLVVGTLPLIAILPLRSTIKALYDLPQLLGFFFLFTALLLYLGEKLRVQSRPPSRLGALAIGAFQAVAVLPGVSRSGATISCARALGWERSEAARFSFLLAIPAILGGAAIESLQLLHGAAPAVVVSPAAYLVGFAASFGVGLAALGLMLRLINARGLTPFALYCLGVGLITLIVFNM